MDGQDPQRSQGIQVIGRAAAILRLLGDQTGGLSLGGIAERCALPRSTVQRIVGALAAEGFVETGSGVRLGPDLIRLARTAASGARDRLRPLMARISEETGETVDLAVLEGRRMRFVDQIVGTQRLRTVSAIGETFPLATTANGKAALACLPEAEAARLVLGEVEEGRASRPVAEILTEVAAIRAGALARDEDEHTDGVSALGFAVAGPGGEVHAVSVPVPSTRYARTADALARTIDGCRAEAGHSVT